MPIKVEALTPRAPGLLGVFFNQHDEHLLCYVPHKRMGKRETYGRGGGVGICSSQNAPDPTSCRPKPTRNTASFSQWRHRIDLPFNGPSESRSMVIVASKLPAFSGQAKPWTCGLFSIVLFPLFFSRNLFLFARAPLRSRRQLKQLPVAVVFKKLIQALS